MAARRSSSEIISASSPYDAVDGHPGDRARLGRVRLAVDVATDGLLVDRVGVGRRPGGLDRDARRHLVEVEDDLLQLDQRGRVRRRDVAGVGLPGATVLVDGVAVGERLERGDPQLLCQSLDLVLTRPGPLAAHLRNAGTVRQREVEVAAADPVTSLEHEDRLPGVVEPARGGQPGQSRADHDGVVAPPRRAPGPPLRR
jgi:hypothetical protein